MMTGKVGTVMTSKNINMKKTSPSPYPYQSLATSLFFISYLPPAPIFLMPFLQWKCWISYSFIYYIFILFF